MQDKLGYYWGACSLHSPLCLLKPVPILRAMDSLPSRCPPFFFVLPLAIACLIIVQHLIRFPPVNDSFGLTLIMPIESRVNPSTNEASSELFCPRRGFFGY